MKKLLLVLLCIVLISGLSPAQVKFGAGPHVGFSFSSFPEGIKDFYGFGFGFGAQGEISIMKYVGARLNFDYHIFPSDKTKLKSLQVTDQFGNPLTITDVTGGNISIVGITANGLGKIPTGSIVTPYGLFGLGLHILSISDLTIKADGAEGTLKLMSSETDFGLNFGAGADVKVAKNLTLFGEFKYVLIFTKDNNSSHIPITFGANYWFD